MLNLQHDGGGGGGSRRSKANPANPGDQVETLQRSKKILRILSDLSARIDEASGKCRQIEDLFSPYVSALRLKIRENAASAIIQSSEYISGPLDISWRKGSYEVLGLAKKLKKYSWNSTEVTLIRGHLIQSVGFYQNLMLKLESGLDFQHENSYGFLHEESKDEKKRGNKKKAIVKCLMFLGDLSRYQLEYADNDESKEFHSKMAKKYYLQCLSLDPGQGQPFNQLAALSSSGSGIIVAVFYYLRCLISEQKFEAAEGNLKKILDKSANNGTSKSIISCLFALFHNLLYEESTKNLSNLCRQALEQVIQDLYSSEKKSSNALYSVCSLILIKSRIKEIHGSKNGAKSAMINAFLLAWFSHLTSKILADLHLDLFGPDSLMDIFATEEPSAKNEDQNGHSIENGVENNNKKRNNNKMRRRKRRKRIQDSADEEEEDEDGNQVTDSEGHDSSSSDEDNDINGNESESESDMSEFLDDDDSDSDFVIEESKAAPTSRQMMKLFQEHPMLEAFSVCCQWLMSSQEILDELSKENSNILFKRLNMLINTLSLDNDKFQKDKDLDNLWIEQHEQLQKIAFSEDKIAKGMELFKTRHASIDFESSSHYKKEQIGLARLMQIESLKSWLCQLPQFKGKTDANQVELQRAEEASSSEKNQLMENMAQLWLQQEVHDLEHETKGKYSPYLVVDHTAMINHMFAIKDIVASKRFAIVVPTAVIQQLDAMKKSEQRARIAIRYLEKQFGQGNHWLRGQKSGECKELKIENYHPSRKEKESWHFFKILECCNHFLGQGVSKGTTNVTLITANEGTKQQEPMLLQVAKSKGINVETVEEFLTKTKIPKKKKKIKNSNKENG